MHPIKRIAWTITALGFGLTGWAPFLYLALARKTPTDRRDLAIHASASVVIFAAMLAVADRRDNVSAIVGFLMCVAAIAAAIHAWVSLGRTSAATKDDAVTVTPRTGADYL
ncbi:hypothetical protein [Streptomyces sp. NPDC056549]|uniref:hypothetical protein n=1 Tax=Streptomyces sp. NPDC056549 TaxID=3345864 RepID=UPI00369078E6